MAKRGSLLMTADYSEDIVGFALDAFLSAATFPRHRLSIEPFTRGKERWLGADARLYDEVTGFKPFYMQFKRPSAYPDHSQSLVVKDRKALTPPLSTEPRALFFQLRAKKEHHTDFQHNILFRWRRRLVNYGQSDAAYVCPLFLERDAYRLHLHLSALRQWFRFWAPRPWGTGAVIIQDAGQQIRFDQVPLLAEHVVIPPHKEVTTASHRYSFDESGDGVCFHSPEHVEGGAKPLGSWLTRLSYGVLQGDGVVPRSESLRVLKDLIEARDDEPALPYPRDLFEQDDGLLAWLLWGDHLKKEYGIEQYAFVRWGDED